MITKLKTEVAYRANFLKYSLKLQAVIVLLNKEFKLLFGCYVTLSLSNEELTDENIEWFY